MKYESNAQKKLVEFISYYNHHPFEYVKLFEGSFGIKLKWYQKILLLIPFKEQRKQKRIDKVMSKLRKTLLSK